MTGVCLLSACLVLTAGSTFALAGSQVCRVFEVPLGDALTDLQVAAISADGERVLFTTAADLTGSNPQQLNQVFVADLQIGSLQQISSFTVARDPQPVRASADLGLVVFSSTSDLTGENADGSSEIFLLQASSGELIQITESPDLNGDGSIHPVISADGSRIAFVSSDDVIQSNPFGPQLFLYNVAEGTLQQVTLLPDRRFGVPSLDASGGRLTYVVSEEGVRDRIVTIDLETQQDRVLLISETLSAPFTSGDGSRLTFATSDDPTSGNADHSAEIYLLSQVSDAETSLQQVTHSFRSQGLASIGAPSMSADGLRIVFPSQIDLTGRNPFGSFQLYSFDLEERDLVQVTRGDSAVLGGQIPLSADGRRMAFVTSLDTAGQSPQAPRSLRWAQCRIRPLPLLVFPQVADGGGIRSEVILTNPGRSLDQGHIVFRDRSGAPLQLSFEGQAASRVDFSVSPGGTFKLVSDAGEDLRLGYAEVFSQVSSSRLSGSLIFTLNGEVSVTGQPPGKEYHVFTESRADSKSGVALANVSTRAADIQLTLRDADGSILRQRSLNLAGGEGVSSFIDELFPDAPAAFGGSLHARSDRFFAMMGLRQSSDLSLSSLSGAPTAFPNAASQMLFYLDAGIDLTALDLTPQQLAEGTVSELTGFSASQNPHLIELVNIHPAQAVTLHLRYFNDRCRQVLEFLLVLDCGETRLIDPFDLDIPATTFDTREWIFQGAPGGGAGLRGSDFRSGRFGLSVTAVGASRNIDGEADLIRPWQLGETPQCAPEVGEIGTQPGLNPANLHSCNALPMSFDYLLGRQVADGSADSCQGPLWIADEQLRSESQVTRQLILRQPGAGLFSCLEPVEVVNCSLIETLNQLGSSHCGEQQVRSSLLIKFPLPTFQLLPGNPSNP